MHSMVGTVPFGRSNQDTCSAASASFSHNHCRWCCYPLYGKRAVTNASRTKPPSLDAQRILPHAHQTEFLVPNCRGTLMSVIGEISPAAAVFRNGDLVTVRPFEEILATLDCEGKLDGLPFMSEMLRYCGRDFRVRRPVRRTCVEGVSTLRQLSDAYFLVGLRCDGSAHEGCQRGCQLFWKGAWLKPAGDEPNFAGCTAAAEGDSSLVALSCPSNWNTPLPSKKGDRFYCQSTELAQATSELPPGRIRHYLEDLRTGDLGLTRVLLACRLAAANFLCRKLFKRPYWRRPTGRCRTTQNPPLGLEPGDLVEVRSAAEIRTTLDAQGCNRGLTFEAEMLRHCGRRYRVARAGAENHRRNHR